MNITPINELIIVKIDENKFSALDTGNKIDKITEAEVVSVGNDESVLKVGDKILVKNYSIQEVNDVYYLDRSNIIGIIKIS